MLTPKAIHSWDGRGLRAAGRLLGRRRVPHQRKHRPKAFPFLLMDLHRQGATGSLKVDGPTYQKALYFRGGRILFGSSNDPKDQLGSILIESGRISPSSSRTSTPRWGPGSPLAKVLAESGFVSQRELSEAARAKVERILSDVLSYDCGSFEFEDGVLPKGAVDLKLSTDKLVLAAVRRVADRGLRPAPPRGPRRRLGPHRRRRPAAPGRDPGGDWPAPRAPRRPAEPEGGGGGGPPRRVRGGQGRLRAPVPRPRAARGGRGPRGIGLRHRRGRRRDWTSARPPAWRSSTKSSARSVRGRGRDRAGARPRGLRPPPGSARAATLASPRRSNPIRSTSSPRPPQRPRPEPPLPLVPPPLGASEGRPTTPTDTNPRRVARLGDPPPLPGRHQLRGGGGRDAAGRRKPAEPRGPRGPRRAPELPRPRGTSHAPREAQRRATGSRASGQKVAPSRGARRRGAGVSARRLAIAAGFLAVGGLGGGRLAPVLPGQPPSPAGGRRSTVARADPDDDHAGPATTLPPAARRPDATLRGVDTGDRPPHPDATRSPGDASTPPTRGCRESLTWRRPPRAAGGGTLGDARAALAERGLLPGGAGASRRASGASGKGSYSVQLLVACSEETVPEGHPERPGAGALHPAGRLQGPLVLPVCWGVYDSEAEARSAVQEIPDYFRKGGASPKAVATATHPSLKMRSSMALAAVGPCSGRGGRGHDRPHERPRDRSGPHVGPGDAARSTRRTGRPSASPAAWSRGSSSGRAPEPTTDPDIQRARARLVQTGDAGEAVRLLHAALARTPSRLRRSRPWPRPTLKLGDARSARDTADRALRLDDRNPASLALRADALVALGDRLGAEGRVPQEPPAPPRSRDPAKAGEPSPQRQRRPRGRAQFRVRYDGGINEPLGMAVLKSLTEAYSEYSRRLGGSPDEPITVVLQTEARFQDGRPPLWADGHQRRDDPRARPGPRRADTPARPGPPPRAGPLLRRCPDCGELPHLAPRGDRPVARGRRSRAGGRASSPQRPERGAFFPS